jgi:hypothetical protein
VVAIGFNGSPVTPKPHDVAGHFNFIEGLLPPDHVGEARRDYVGSITSREYKRYSPPLQLVSNVKHVASAQADVENGDIEPTLGELIPRVVEIANECDHICADRIKRYARVVGKKPRPRRPGPGIGPCLIGGRASGQTFSRRTTLRPTAEIRPIRVH